MHGMVLGPSSIMALYLEPQSSLGVVATYTSSGSSVGLWFGAHPTLVLRVFSGESPKKSHHTLYGIHSLSRQEAKSFTTNGRCEAQICTS